MKSYGFLKKAGVCIHPEYYSGRGPDQWDCGEQHLSIIYQEITKEIGQEAASNFAEMVGSLDCAGASEIINGLYNLEHNNWVYIPVKMSRIGSLIESAGKNEDGTHNVHNLNMGLMSLIADNRDDSVIRSQSDRIKREFFNRNRLKPKSFPMVDPYCPYRYEESEDGQVAIFDRGNGGNGWD